ncbi:MAG TPA: DUF2059 domain-containing protein [Verrucomicrobiae bacterium]|nr:DUF2059 domain-containing protein [Verrucomicrobiae bacterium]
MKSIWVAALFAAGSLAAAPADFAGTWKVKYAGPPMTGPKTIGSMIFDFKIDGGRVAGFAHIGTWPGLAPIAGGKVDGDHISFTATGYLPSSSGIPTCRIEGTISGDELVVKLSQIRSIGGPGSGGVYEYHGGKLDAAAARTEKLAALAALSVHHVYSGYPDVEPQPPVDVDATLRTRAPRLAANVAAWEQVKPRGPEADAFSNQDLDDLIAFYNSPAGQAMIAAQHPEVETAIAAFLARR